MSECNGKTLKRIGTVFYQLENIETPFISLNERTMRFQGWSDTTEERELKILMSKFTPNFDQEEWKYKALETLETKFKWNK